MVSITVVTVLRIASHALERKEPMAFVTVSITDLIAFHTVETTV